MKDKKNLLKKRHRKIRSKIFGTEERPRLQVFRSLNHTYASLIDDSCGKTIASVSSKDNKTKQAKGKTDPAFAVGEAVAKKAKEKNIEKVVFDRKGYLYHGRVKAVAEGARKGGLVF